jgi:hypothetical protein
MVSVNDFALRPARVLTRDDVFSTGRYRFRFIPTPHVPHGWAAGVLFEESEKTLFCSDLFHQWDQLEPTTSSSIIERCEHALVQTEAGPFANYVPYTHHTGLVLHNLAEYNPKTLAVMHGSSYSGDGGQALRDLATVMREVQYKIKRSVLYRWRDAYREKGKAGFGQPGDNLGTFTTFPCGRAYRRYPIRLGSTLTRSVFWVFGALLHLNRLGGGPDSNRHD